MALATLSVDLVAKIAKFEQDLGKLARTAEQRADQMSKAFAGVAGALGALGVGLSAGAAFAWIKNVIDGLDAMNDLRDATGASIENISALEDVARRTGTGFDTVSTSLVKFNQALSTAKPGSDAAAAFDLLNLKVGELKSLDPAEALLRVATALASFADDGNKARITQELFGKSLKEVAPFLKDLAEAGKLNATVTTKQAEEAEKFNKELFNLQKNAADGARALAGPLVEGINAVIEKFRQARKEKTGLFDSINGIVARDRAKSDAMFTGSWYVGNAGRGSVNPEAVRPSVGSLPDPKKPVSTSQSEAERYLEQLQKQLEKTQDLTVIEQVLTDIEKGRISGLTPAIQKQLEATAHLIDAMHFQVAAEKELAAAQEERIKIGRQAAIDQGVDNSAYQENLKRLLDATPTAQLEKAREDMILLTQEFEAGRLSESQYLEAVSARADITAEKLEKTKSIAEELGLSFSSAFEDAIVGGKNLGDILKGLEQDILRIVTRKAITEPLGNAISGAIGGSGGIGGLASKFFGSLFSFDGGGFTGNGSRLGGVDGKGGFLSVLHPQESVIDHSRGQRTGNVVSITVNQSFGANTSRATTLQAAADARRQLDYAGRNM